MGVEAEYTRITQSSLDEVVYRILREIILSPGGLGSGDRIDEKDLSTRLGVSRTPIREAIRRLEVEGLVTRAPRRGAFVADLSPEAIGELYSIREVLEGLAARMAASKASEEDIATLRDTYGRYADAVRDHAVEAILSEDTEFHDLIARASRNERLQATIRMFRDQLRLLRTRSVAVAGGPRNPCRQWAASSRRSRGTRPAGPKRPCGCTSAARSKTCSTLWPHRRAKAPDNGSPSDASWLSSGSLSTLGDGNVGGHPAGRAVTAVREEQRGMVGGAQARDGHGSRRNAGVDELPAVSLPQVEHPAA